MGTMRSEGCGIVLSDHARQQWKKRFRKLKRPGTMEAEVERASVVGSSGENTYYKTPCGAILVVTNCVVKTVLLGRYLPDALRDALRNK